MMAASAFARAAQKMAPRDGMRTERMSALVDRMLETAIRTDESGGVFHGDRSRHAGIISELPGLSQSPADYLAPAMPRIVTMRPLWQARLAAPRSRLHFESSLASALPTPIAALSHAPRSFLGTFAHSLWTIFFTFSTARFVILMRISCRGLGSPPATT